MGRLYYVVSVVVLLLLELEVAVCSSGSTVEFLPGFDYKLPFHLETGYIGVGDSEEVQLFYYFIKSQGDAQKDPLLLWLTGGPACSGFSGLVFEIGPLYFEVVEYNGSLPTLTLNKNSWTQAASIIFVDSPVNTGYSYATSPNASKTGDFIQVNQLYQFFRKWLIDHPEFIPNPVYVGGDSYAGIPLPPLVKKISIGNEEGAKPFINLQGYLLGNAAADHSFDENAKVPFAHGMGLISNELYESLKQTCRGQYININSSNSECLKHMQEFSDSTSGLNQAHILEPNCAFLAPRPRGSTFCEGRRSLVDSNFRTFADSDPSLPTIECRLYVALLAKYWMNDESVQKALHIREGTIGEWIRCKRQMPYAYDIDSTLEYHKYLSKKGYRSLIYSGDHDMLVPFLGTEAWIKSLNYSIVDDWRPWHLQGQVAGYTRSYSNRMTFATIKGGGHTAPEYKPPECLAMFKRWINQDPL